jgi:hypothetical protein
VVNPDWINAPFEMAFVGVEQFGLRKGEWGILPPPINFPPRRYSSNPFRQRVSISGSINVPHLVEAPRLVLRDSFR